MHIRAEFIKTTELDGVLLLSPPAFTDERGCFRPIFARRLHEEAGIRHAWQEMNISETLAGCVRGLHYQMPNPQAKLITVIAGQVFDVVVDLRADSRDFGKWESFELSKDGPYSQIYIPEGFAHGIATSVGPATIAYLVSVPWSPKDERVLAWDDPDLAIPWPVTAPVLSRRDRDGCSLASLS